MDLDYKNKLQSKHIRRRSERGESVAVKGCMETTQSFKIKNIPLDGFVK
jgi:hypothetical protein